MKLSTVWVLAGLILTAPVAHAKLKLPGGKMETASGGSLPLLHSHAKIHVTTDLATVKVTQTFRNTSDAPLAARYVFPLPHDAAVFAMTMTVGDEVVKAEIRTVQQAQQTFQKAKREGKTAALLEQHRANVFTQDVANIPAEETVVIVIEYAQSVVREEGGYQLHYPMAVASRYDNRTHGTPVPEAQKSLPQGLYHHEDREDAAPVGQPAQKRMQVEVHLDAGVPIVALESPSHPLEIDRLADDRARVFLAQGLVVDDRDFVLRYRLAGDTVSAGLVQHADRRGEFFSLLVEPPTEVPDDAVAPRELVFVIDASCSMGGAPLKQSKAVMGRMLDTIRPEDTFRFIVFGSSTAELHRDPLPPTAKNLAAAEAFLKNLGTMGGTEIELGIQAALEPKVMQDRMRMVVFFTDGHIGDELRVMATIKEHRNNARIFSFGVGDATNRWLLEEMAIAGHGVARIVGLNDDPERVVKDFAARLRAPFLTDAWVDFGDCAVHDVVPAGTFDLYAGAPVRLIGRMPRKGCKASPDLRGRQHGRAVKMPISVTRLDRKAGAEAMAVLWARAQVAQRMRWMARPHRNSGNMAAEQDQIISEITELGLDFGITTRWTAFVAVAERTVDAPVSAQEKFRGRPKSSAPLFGGSSSPEPAEWAAILMLLAMSAFVLQRSRSGG